MEARNQQKQLSLNFCMLLLGFLLGLLFEPEVGGVMFLRNVSLARSTCRYSSHNRRENFICSVFISMECGLSKIMYDLRLSQRWLWRMSSCGIWRCVDLASTDRPYGIPSLSPCSDIAGCFWLVAQSAVTCSRWFTARGFSTLKMEAIRSSETSVDARSTQR
jgi:hypothetical protein